jgi:hypothetical protein
MTFTVNPLITPSGCHKNLPAMSSGGRFRDRCRSRQITSTLIVVAVVILAVMMLTGVVRVLNEEIARQEPMASLKLGRLEDLSFPASQISAEAIMAEIDAARPFQATKAVAQYFQGAKVDWTLPLVAVEEQEGGKSRLTFQSSGAHGSGIVIVTLPTKELNGINAKLAPPTTLVHVRGTIKSADGSSVTLTDAFLVQ